MSTRSHFDDSSLLALETGAKAAQPSARSIVQSVLLGSDPPALSTGALVRTAQMFAISPGTTRVAIARMVAAGELAYDRTRYRIAGPLVARHAEVASARAPRPSEPWDGTWTVVVISSDEARPRAQRQATQIAMRQAQMANLRDGTWVRPGPPTATLELPDQAITFSRATATGLDPDQVAHLWGLREWAKTAESNIAAIRGLLADRTHTDDLPALFLAGSSALGHLTRDPRLPPELLPAQWPADDLRSQWQRCDQRVRVQMRAWLRSAQLD